MFCYYFILFDDKILVSIDIFTKVFDKKIVQFRFKRGGHTTNKNNVIFGEQRRWKMTVCLVWGTYKNEDNMFCLEARKVQSDDEINISTGNLLFIARDLNFFVLL